MSVSIMQSDPQADLTNELASMDGDFMNSGESLPPFGINEPIFTPDGPMVTTYTFWKAFKNCRKSCFWRYLQQIVPIQKAAPLAFGTLMHKCLEIWHGGKGLDAVLGFIDHGFPNRDQQEDDKANWHLLTSMMKGYAKRYPVESFTVIALEKKFSGKITNPATRSASRSFLLAGKVDGIIQDEDGDYWILEHKSAAYVDSSYIEKLWTDFQIILYSYYIEQDLGIPIIGILYNVSVKTRMRQKLGETEEEFKVRYAEACAKNKSGKSTAKRELPESDEQFQARLAEHYCQTEAFYRERILISRDQYESLRSELWELTQSFLEARRRNMFYQNSDHCFVYHRPCPYFQLCRSNGSPTVMANCYEHRAPNEELNDEGRDQDLQSDAAF